MATLAIDYRLVRSDAEFLGALVLMPTDLRRELIVQRIVSHGIDSVLNLFVQYVGMSNAVVDNQREALETFAVVEVGMHPYSAEKLNLPTMLGACVGASIADGIDETKLCEGCAFRLGTCANQSPVTTADAEYCGRPGEVPFMCHEDMADGEPTRGCAGFAQLRAARKREAA